MWQEGLETWAGTPCSCNPLLSGFHPLAKAENEGEVSSLKKGLLEVRKFGEDGKPYSHLGAGVVAEMNRGGT